jgi:hypothetical protein
MEAITEIRSDKVSHLLKTVAYSFGVVTILFIWYGTKLSSR